MGGGNETIVYWPALLDSQKVTEVLHLDGKTTEVLPTQRLGLEEKYYQQVPVEIAQAPSGPTVKAPLGSLFGARSGDKGGCANCGVWAKTDEAYSFLHSFLTVDRFKELCPDVSQYQVLRYELANMRSLNFYIKGILKDGVSSNNRIDGQAKSFGEYLRAKVIDIPQELLGS
jgi:hypothetical protein